ncbi:MAG: asparagine synthase-related protein [Porticoccaceae bacterium]|jgi:asparagine synthase (glutamine-hydrolysing)|nr:asparagine synthase-related protein [Porticoccaceae bacterium]
MSALFGILSLSGAPIPPEDSAALADALASWSPEPPSLVHGDGAVLGCKHLRATPESLGEMLPWRHPPSGLVITADVRLDNRNALIGALGLAGEGIPDSQIILHAFLRWGRRCPEQLLGDFAFAIWNPATRELFCARDGMGGRPFAYARCRDYFAFASSPEALLHLPWTGTTLEQGTLANLLVYSYLDVRDNATWYADVDCIPPGHSLWVDGAGREELGRYWAPAIGEPLRFSSVDEAREAFREVFGQAVKDRLRGVGPPAMLLSGGMDSSAIAAMVEILGEGGNLPPVHTYSVIGDVEEGCIESRCIRVFADKAAFRPHYLRVPSVTGVSDAATIFDLAWGRPHPVDNDILLQSTLIQAAGRAGHRVMLHGTSGDLTLWSSRAYIANLLASGAWRQAWRECRAASDHHTYHYGHPALKILAYGAYHAFAPPLVRHGLWALRGGKQDGSAYGFLDPAFAETLDLPGYFRRYRSRRHRLGLREAYEEDLLRQIVSIKSALGGSNRLGGRHGVEMRDPFGDRRVAEFFLCLPEAFKVRDGWTKFLTRTAFPDQLPDFLRFRRGKETLARRIHLAAMDQDPGFVEQAVKDSVPRLFSALARDHVAAIHRGYREGDPAASRRLYDYITWAGWLQWLDGLPPGATKRRAGESD